MPNWFSKKTCITYMLVRYLLQAHFFFINQITPDSIPCVKYTECCLKVGHQRSMGTRRYHMVSLSADLECHSPIKNPGQIPSLLHLSLLMSGQWTVTCYTHRLARKGTCWPGCWQRHDVHRELLLDEQLGLSHPCHLFHGSTETSELVESPRRSHSTA